MARRVSSRSSANSSKAANRDPVLLAVSQAQADITPSQSGTPAPVTISRRHELQRPLEKSAAPPAGRRALWHAHRLADTSRQQQLFRPHARRARRAVRQTRPTDPLAEPALQPCRRWLGARFFRSRLSTLSYVTSCSRVVVKTPFLSPASDDSICMNQVARLQVAGGTSPPEGTAQRLRPPSQKWRPKIEPRCKAARSASGRELRRVSNRCCNVAGSGDSIRRAGSKRHGSRLRVNDAAIQKPVDHLFGKIGHSL